MRSAAVIWQEQMEFELKQKEIVAEKDKYIAKLEASLRSLKRESGNV